MDPSEIEQLLDKHRDKFRRLLRAIAAEEAGPDPFAFSLSRYRNLGPAARLDLVRRAGAIARDRVDEELSRRGAAWIVLMGDKVVAEANDPTACPTAEEILALGDQADLVPYLFEAPLVEELTAKAVWAPLGNTDAYPTIPIAIVGEELVADLDTGSHGTFLDARLLPSAAATWFEGRHLGQPFHWTPARARITVRSEDTHLERELPARFVHGWTESPFVRINASRTALVGRDLLRAFGLRVRLETPEQRTVVESTQ
jgi:hypothetical protein